jgi:hypothetical protein
LAQNPADERNVEQEYQPGEEGSEIQIQDQDGVLRLSHGEIQIQEQSEPDQPVIIAIRGQFKGYENQDLEGYSSVIIKAVRRRTFLHRIN